VDKLWDKTRLLKEGKEVAPFLARQAFNQIPGMSAVAALIVGWWVASTFTTSPFRAFMARWGLMKGGRHVVSGSTYRFLSIVLPILVAAVTAYAVSKILKVVREQQIRTALRRGVPHEKGESVQRICQNSFLADHGSADRQTHQLTGNPKVSFGFL